VLPYIRVPSTDLNMTLGLALVAVVMIEVMGVRALGLGYFNKFVPIKRLIVSPAGAMDLIIGILELIGELARILSFSFRLLGNIFAGSILLFVVSFLVPAIIPWGLFLFEFFVGIIQALIFGLLTAIFMNTATIGHHGEEHGEAEAAH
jgi:F-type H+-transporting ATPase subunit a